MTALTNFEHSYLLTLVDMIRSFRSASILLKVGECSHFYDRFYRKSLSFFYILSLTYSLCAQLIYTYTLPFFFFQKDVSKMRVFCNFYSVTSFFMDSIFIIGVKLAQIFFWGNFFCFY